MAIHIHNTPSGVDEPGLPPAGLLRSRGAPCRVLSHGEMLALLDDEKPELPPEPLLAADVRPTAWQTSGALTLRAETPICATVAQFLPESGSADLALARHARRQLEAALDHGTALLAALGLPRLVGDGFVPIDLEAAGKALADAVALLDAMDPDQDFEPEDELLEPGGDDELDLGWSALHSQVNLGSNTVDGDLTALETHGKGFRRSGAEDAEDGADAEETYEDPWWSCGDQMSGSEAHA